MIETDSLFDSAVAHHRAGRPAQAGAVCQEIIRRAPDHARALHLLGAIRYANGDSENGLILVRRAVESKPDYAEAHFNLGAMLAALSRPDEAASHYAAAARLKPDDIVAHVRHGAMLDAAGRIDDAIAQYHSVLTRWPDCLPALLDIGSLYLLRGETAPAIEFNRRAAQVAPNNPVAALRLGRSLKQAGLRPEAIAEYRRSLSLQPDNIEALNFLAVALFEHGAVDDAEDTISRALTLQPDNAAAHFNSGQIALAIGDPSRTRASIRRALELDPENPIYRRGALCSLLYDPRMTEAERAAMHQDFGAWVTSKATPAISSNTSPDSQRQIRIGWLSSDFRDHPVSRNVEPILSQFDRSQFKMLLYGHVAAPNETTRQLQHYTDGWYSTIGKSDAELAERIRADRIDILIILAGHLDNNRPEMAAWRAAPVQVSFHDPASSGITAMDYLIADHRLVPHDCEEWFSERVLKLPTFYLHAPIWPSPDLAPPPMVSAGTVTFGSFNNPAKINDDVISLWARVLKAVPRSRLILKYRQNFGERVVRQRIERKAVACGIDPTRIALEGEREDRAVHLARYQNIDIALDPFPFSGSTTTFEALWMGVPVVTLSGSSMVSRWSTAMLGAVRMEELVALSEEDYVRIAAGLAGDPEKLTQIRAVLRQRISDSPLCDSVTRTRHFERLMKAVWRRWCAQQRNGAFSPAR